jgi:glucose-6-phosphate isomerase
MVKVDLSGAESAFSPAGPDYALAAQAHRTLFERSGESAEFIGWMELPMRTKVDELRRILAAARRIRENSQVLVVIGIGGSYLGARAAIELLAPTDGVEVIFVGNGLSPDYLTEAIERIGDRDFSINVISKSGTTLEPALAFRVFREMAKERYGAGAAKRIYATTDANRGALKSLADSEGYECFVVPDDVGGRFSVLSAVGLLPMAAAGIDVTRILDTADEAMRALDLRSPDNPAWQYAAARQQLYTQGKSIEILASYEPRFHYMAEWWKQLFGESEGKNGVGIYPASVEYSADLHSMGQYIQDGPRNLMESVVLFEHSRNAVSVPFALGDPDGLNYLAGHDLGDICAKAAQAVRAAHIDGGVPNITITVPARDEDSFAWLVCFFEMSCAISAYMSGVNPFDQPGVEAYKANMFRLLGKPEA